MEQHSPYLLLFVRLKLICWIPSSKSFMWWSQVGAATERPATSSYHGNESSTSSYRAVRNKPFRQIQNRLVGHMGLDPAILFFYSEFQFPDFRIPDVQIFQAGEAGGAAGRRGGGDVSFHRDGFCGKGNQRSVNGSICSTNTALPIEHGSVRDINLMNAMVNVRISVMNTSQEVLVWDSAVRFSLDPQGSAACSFTYASRSNLGGSITS